MAEHRLDDAEVAARVARLDGWAVVGGRLHRELAFADFNQAFGFMARVALAAEKLDHHPDWSNSWNRVVLDVSSHAAGGLTERCFELARQVDRILDQAIAGRA